MKVFGHAGVIPHSTTQAVNIPAESEHLTSILCFDLELSLLLFTHGTRFVFDSCWCRVLERILTGL